MAPLSYTTAHIGGKLARASPRMSGALGSRGILTAPSPTPAARPRDAPAMGGTIIGLVPGGGAGKLHAFLPRRANMGNENGSGKAHQTRLSSRPSAKRESRNPCIPGGLGWWYMGPGSRPAASPGMTAELFRRVFESRNL